MYRPSLELSHVLLAVISIALWPSGNALPAPQEAISDDGREVILKQDGSWEFRSNDRFARTTDGRRVRLKADGSWQYAGNALLASKQQLRTADLNIKLRKVVIETQEKKIQKNKRVKSRTIFYLDLESSPQAQKDINIDIDNIGLIKVTDSNGRDYPVLAIQPSPMTLKPDSASTVIVYADGSPKWWKDVKSMEIVFQPGMFDLQEPVSLMHNVVDFDQQKVGSFKN
ncbi:MAG: hypothetical protein WBO93_14265 [Gammaproteobacteria bacterium]